MRGGSSRDLLRHLRTLYRCGVVGPLGDEQLLDRFVARRDEMGEEAFAELVRRHGPMVLGVCRRVLGDAHEAEDAFQATFLVLARKAASVVRRGKLANWLYGVAVRTAREARDRAARRRAREERVRTPVQVEPPDDGSSDELRAILDEELARLPARYRRAVVLCELEGLSRPEAARRLGVPEGTLSSRLARAKAQLRDRLARRGVTLPTVALSAALLREAHAATLPLSLLESTMEAAMLVAAGSSAAVAISASVASLTQGVLKAMLLAKLKGIVLGLGTLTAAVSGAVVLAQSRPAPEAAPALVAEVQDPEREPTKPIPSNPGPPPPQTDRTATLEKKLDRILEALDRLSRRESVPKAEALGFPPIQPAPALGLTLHEIRPGVLSGNSPTQPAPPPEPTLPPTQPAPPPEPTLPGPPPARDPVLAPSPPAREVYYYSPRPPTGSLADRLSAVEARLSNFERSLRNTDANLMKLARRLVQLEERVGGTSSVSPATTAPPPPPTPVQH